MENELWVPVLGYEETHEVSNLGRIRNISKFNKRVLKPRKTNDGYLYLQLCKNYIRLAKKVHKIVSESFWGKHKGMSVNHIDGNKLNNNLSNLEIVSFRENYSHRSLMYKKSSKYPNVTWDKGHHKWRAQVYINGKQKYIGIFDDEEKAYRKLCLFLHNEGIENKYIQ
jgi:hypothetical protein